MAEQPQPMIYQVFIKLLNGKSQALNFQSLSSITPLSIKHRLSLLTNIPPSSFLLLLPPPPSLSTPFPLFGTLLLRLRGGKGGFGSLLRGAATKAGQKKTNNFDACRDMSGRRLRHVNAERRMEEWAAGAGERGLERAAEKFLREKEKGEQKRRREGGGADTEKYVGKYREDSARCVEVVERAVREAVGGNKRRKKIGACGEGSKKLNIWMGKRKVDNSDSEDTDGDDSDDNEEQEKENFVALDNENHLDSNKEPEGNSDSVAGGKTNQNICARGSSENSLDGEEETAVQETSVNGESSGEAMVEETAEQKRVVLLLEDTVVPETEAVETENVKIGQVPEGEALECKTADAEISLDHLPNLVVVAQEEIVSKSTIVAVPVEPLNFEEFSSSAELEALGMEKLKSELQSRGLKCGGTVQERAARLFLLKTTPLEKLPKKLLAKK